MRAEERRYYDLRAAEYDDWYLGRGRFESVDRPAWDAELAALAAVLERLPAGRILDIACGTGFLTRQLPGDVTGLDASEAMLAEARLRCPGKTFVRGDALALPFDDASFDVAVAAHFYGHLRDAARTLFLAEARRVAPSLVVVDSRLRPGVAAEEVQERVLNDGSRHEVYRRYFTAEGLADALAGGRTLFDGTWFVAVAS